ncbi:hypothetical protein AB1E18_007107 [Capra hircus]
MLDQALWNTTEEVHNEDERVTGDGVPVDSAITSSKTCLCLPERGKEGQKKEAVTLFIYPLSILAKTASTTYREDLTVLEVDRSNGNYNSAYRARGGGRALVEFRTLPQPMGPRGRLPGLLIGGAGRPASRGPLEGAAEVEVPEAGLRQDLRVSSCGGGSIQRRCQ